MKRFFTLFAIGALAGMATIAHAGQRPATGVNGSFHDITFLGATRGDYNQDDFQRVCIFCHTPHNAEPNGTVAAPLWNHEPTTVDLAPYTWAAPANLTITFNESVSATNTAITISCGVCTIAGWQTRSSGTNHGRCTALPIARGSCCRSSATRRRSRH